MLRTGVLTGRTIALSGAPEALGEALETLGATLGVVSAPTFGAETTVSAPDTLVVDARGAFADAGGGYDGVRAGVDGTFAAIRDIAVAHWVEQERAGQAVVVAPPPGAGRHAAAARAALDNLVRTLSTEWARHAVTTVAVLPGDATTDAALADMVAWLATPAGAYLSGTSLTLDVVPSATNA